MENSLLQPIYTALKCKKSTQPELFDIRCLIPFLALLFQVLFAKFNSVKFRSRVFKILNLTSKGFLPHYVFLCFFYKVNKTKVAKCFCFDYNSDSTNTYPKGPFIYYVSTGQGAWVQKMAIFGYLRYINHTFIVSGWVRKCPKNLPMNGP